MPPTINKTKDSNNTKLRDFFAACGGYSKFRQWEIGALCELVDDLIGHNLWEKMVAVYPFVGRTADAHSYNIIDIKKYKISWTGSLTHNDYGMTGGGGRGATGIPLNLFANKENDLHLSAYNRTHIQSSTFDGRLIGVNSMKLLEDAREIGAQEINFNTVTGIVGYIYGEYRDLAGFGYARDNLGGVDGKGLFIANCSESCHLNGQIFGSQFPLLPSKITSSTTRQIILLGNRHEGSITSSARVNLAFASVGYGFSGNDIQNLTKIVEKFQKAMFRSAL